MMRCRLVAQISNLLYRRLAACGAPINRTRTRFPGLCRLEIGDTADCKSALQTLDAKTNLTI